MTISMQLLISHSILRMVRRVQCKGSNCLQTHSFLQVGGALKITQHALKILLLKIGYEKKEVSKSAPKQ